MRSRAGSGRRSRSGPDGIRAMFAEWNEAFTEFDLELSEARRRVTESSP